MSSLYEGESYYDERQMGSSAEAAWTERAAGVLAQLPRRPLSALDLGAGAGHLVKAFRDLGVAAGGVEPSSAGRRLAARLYGIELSPVVPLSESFDLVTMVHSLEHTIDPVATLRTARAVLRPDGFLFLEVPNAQTVEMLRPSRQRDILDLPAHLYHFVPETLCALLNLVGFQDLRVLLSNCDALEWVLSRRRAKDSLRPTVPDLEAASLSASEGETPPSRSAGVRALWRETALPGLRRLFPGWQFRVVASRAQEP